MAATDRPFIHPYEPPGGLGVGSTQRGQLPGSFEPASAAERYVDNMKKSPLPVTWGGVAGAVGGTLIGGVYGGALGVGVGLYLERKWRTEKQQR
mmetsp:Transcript_104567/g.320313  ORF Transcript_104567/g.320313 Transcript_104567/m.320313 type:complete len:94 (-) Transcript_104567:145-426(-)